MLIEEYQKIYLYRRIVQAKLFIDANYATSIDAGNIADEALFSKFHFIRLFKKIYAKTPHQYLTFVRIEKARQFLQAGNSVTDVCFLVGFDSLSSFSSLFKRRVGQTPNAYSMQLHRFKKEMGQDPLKFIPQCFAYQNGWTKNSNFEEAIL